MTHCDVHLYTPASPVILRASQTGKPAKSQSLNELVHDMSLQQLLRQSKDWLNTIAYFVNMYPNAIDKDFLEDYKHVKSAPLLLLQALNGRSHLEQEARDLTTSLLMMLSEVSSAVQGGYRSVRSDGYIRSSAIKAAKTADETHAA